MSSLSDDDLCRLFKKLDQNNDGLVSIDELQWLLDAMYVACTADELGCLTGKHGLNLTEFINFYNVITMKDSSEISNGEGNDLESDLFKAFGVFDKNRDGFISSEELHGALSTLGLWDEHRGMDIKHILKAYDANSDGVLDFQEFKKMMSA